VTPKGYAALSNRRNQPKTQTTDDRLPPQFLEPRRIGGGVTDGVLNVPVSEIILNQPRVRTLIGQGETRSMWGWAATSRPAASPYRLIISHTVLRERGARRSLINSVLPSGCIRSRSASHFLTALISSPRNGCVVESPFFRRRTCSVRPSRSRSATVKPSASDTRRPCRNIRSNRQRSRLAFRRPWAATISFSISRNLLDRKMDWWAIYTTKYPRSDCLVLLASGAGFDIFGARTRIFWTRPVHNKTTYKGR